MISSTFSARLILVVFAITQAVFSWSLRLLPRPIRSRLVSQTLAALIGAVLFSLMVSELFLYAAATGHVPLKNDKFFMTVFFTQQIIASIIVLNSDSVARRKEKALPKS